MLGNLVVSCCLQGIGDFLVYLVNNLHIFNYIHFCFSNFFIARTNWSLILHNISACSISLVFYFSICFNLALNICNSQSFSTKLNYNCSLYSWSLWRSSFNTLISPSKESRTLSIYDCLNILRVNTINCSSVLWFLN